MTTLIGTPTNLVQGQPDALAEFAADFGCVPLAERELRIPDRRKAVIAS
jgi:hypothetical protein